MERAEAIRLIALGILAAGDCTSRNEACEQAEALLNEYLRRPVYRIVGVEVPAEFVTDALDEMHQTAQRRAATATEYEYLGW